MGATRSSAVRQGNGPRCETPDPCVAATASKVARGLIGIGPLYLVMLTGGCSQAPAFDIMGSLFPAWIFCIALGILLAALTRWLLARWQVRLLFPVVAYPCLAAIFTFSIWLIFF